MNNARVFGALGNTTFHIILIYLIFVLPQHRICKKISSLVPSLSHEELWWPITKGILVNVFLSLILEIFAYYLSILDISIVGIVASNYFLLYFSVRWILFQEYVKKDWSSRGISKKDLERGLGRGVLSTMLLGGMMGGGLILARIIMKTEGLKFW